MAYLVNALDTNTMVSLRSLLNSSTAAYNGERMNMYYAASWGLIRFLIEDERYASGLPRFVRSLQNGTTGLRAFEESFGDNFAEFEKAWTQG